MEKKSEEREKNRQKSTERDTKMLLETDRDKKIDLIGEKVSNFCWTHIAVGHRIQGGSTGPLRSKYAVVLS